MIVSYEAEMAKLPKGVLINKTIKGNQYFYLQYRDGKKIVSEYIGKDYVKIEKLQNQIERRKHIQAMLKALHAEYAAAQKMMGVSL